MKNVSRSIMAYLLLLVASASADSLKERAQTAEKLFFAANQQDLSSESRWRYLPLPFLNTCPKALTAYVAVKNGFGLFLGTMFGLIVNEHSLDICVPDWTGELEKKLNSCGTNEEYEEVRNKLSNAWEQRRKFIRAANCMGYYCAYHIIKNSIPDLKPLQKRLIVCADFLRVAQEIADATGSDLLAQLRANENPEVRQLMRLLESKTFEGKASLFSNWGAILVAHNLFEKHKQEFMPVVGMVNDFVAAE